MLDTRAFANHAGIARAVRTALAMLKPPPDLPPSAWAEANVRIPTGNAIPGPYRIANAPYQREPMDQFVNPDCYRVTLKWGAQIGKTLTLLCIQGYAIDMRPRSQMMMQPSQGDAQTWLETKFNPLVEASPGIARRIAKPRGREGVNNQRMKSYPGGFLMMAWSGSPKTMRGRSAPFIGCDEVDGYARSPEGHPVGLLWQRSATFGDDRFLFEISTPTITGASYIDESFEAGDQRRFHVICPHCEARQAMRWENVTWIGRMSTCLADALEDNTHDDHQPQTAVYRCEACAATWNDGQRIAAIRTAEANGAGWIAAKPFKGHASYHLWEAYSTMRKLGDIVRDYLDKLKTDDLQTFANVSLSETYEEAGDKADPTTLEARALPFAAEVPMDGVYLTAGIDMQPDRLEVETVAWGEGEESWSVDYRVLWGDPLAGDVWDDLDAFLAGTYQHETGAPLSIMAACLDTGGNKGYTQCAYDYLRGKTGRRLFGIKGVGGWGRPIVEKMQRKQSGKNARKIDLFVVGVDEAKLVVMRRLANKVPGPGYCHIPAGRNAEDNGLDLAEWCRQITAEKLVVHYVKGQPVREWHKPDKARNEALDCRAYALAALKIMQPSLRRAKQKLMAHPRAKAMQSATDPAHVEDALPIAPTREPKRTDIKTMDSTADAPAMEPKRKRTETGRVHRSQAARRANWVNGWKK
jgi:phage terminase large subunit GpA-like protein